MNYASAIIAVVNAKAYYIAPFGRWSVFLKRKSNRTFIS